MWVTLLPSGEWLVRAFVRSGIWRFVHRLPVALVVVVVVGVCLLVFGRWLLRRRSFAREALRRGYVKRDRVR